jgi:hypothetical protein
MTAEILTLFELPEPEPEPLPDDAVAAELRDPTPVNAAVVGGLGWLTTLTTPTVPPTCRSCGTVHVYRAPAGFVLACRVCFPAEVAA